MTDSVQWPEEPISWDTIAKRLLQEKYLLTALELHSELLESGKVIPILYSYFSDPSNFENCSRSGIEGNVAHNSFHFYRTPSQTTLDSLDWSRHSEEGEKDEKVAVLEFELRKARETIQALRNNLTQVAENVSIYKGKNEQEETIKPYQKRILNFLINEYLLNNNYKMAAITFADENDNQDFENWDDVGLNMPRPPPLVQLIQEVGYTDQTNTCNKECQTFSVQTSSVGVNTDVIVEKNTNVCDFSHTVIEEAEIFPEVDQLPHKICCLESDKANETELEKKVCIEDIGIQRRHSQRKISNYLFKMVRNICNDDGLTFEDEDVSDIVSTIQDEKGLVKMLSQCLPEISCNLNSAKRENIILLLVYCVVHNSAAVTREKLVHLVFNLVKRPDDKQKRSILFGIFLLANLLSPEQLEVELLPQCWEQMNHKHSERRVLVAQAVGVLAPFTLPHLRDSLLFSVLQQMINMEERKDVINAAIKSLCILTTYFEDESKFKLLIPLLMRSIELYNIEPLKDVFVYQSLLTTNNFSLIQILYCIICNWALDLNMFHLILESQIQRITSLANSCNVSNKYIMEIKESLHTHLSCLIFALPYIWTFLIKCLPNSESAPTSLLTSQYFHAIIQDLAVIYEDKQIAESNLSLLNQFFSKEWHKTWFEFDFLVEQFLPNLIESLCYIDASVNSVLRSYVFFFANLSAFSFKFTDTYIKPLMQKKLAVSDDINIICKGKTPLSTALTVIYCVSVLASSTNFLSELEDFISNQIHIMALCRGPLVAVKSSVLLLITYRQYHETVFKALWTSVVHRSPEVRSVSAAFWDVLINLVSEDLLISRVVPPLVTLATDSDPKVRSSTVVSLCRVLSSSSKKELCDKALLQLENVCEESQVVENICLQEAIAVACLHLAAELPSNLMNNLLLCRLCKGILDGRGKPEERFSLFTKFLETYSALLNCNIPDHIIAHFILPALQHLQKCFGAASHEVESVAVLMQEYTLRMHSDRKQVGVIGSGILNTSGMEDVKNRMSNLFLGKSGSPQSLNIPSLFKKK